MQRIRPPDATGFTHQGHLAYHMRRILGSSPKAIRELRRQGGET